MIYLFALERLRHVPCRLLQPTYPQCRCQCRSTFWRWTIWWRRQSLPATIRRCRNCRCLYHKNNSIKLLDCNISWALLSIFIVSSASFSVCLSLCFSADLSLYISVSLSVCLLLCFSVDLSLYISVSLSVCLSLCFSVDLSLYNSVSLSVCLSLCFSVIFLSTYISVSLRSNK